MKKMLCLALILVCIMQIPNAIGESILPILPTIDDEETPSSSVKAPSYEAMAYAAADSVTKNEQGGTIVTYSNVDEQGYNDFGVYLGERGFFVAKQEKEGNLMAFTLSDGTVEFTLIYDQPNHIMYNIYPKGTAYEQWDYPGYKPVFLGKEIEIKGLGKFTFTKVHLNGKAYFHYAAYIDKETNEPDTFIMSDFCYEPKYVYSWIDFDYYNTSTKSRDFKGEKSDLFSPKLIYENEYDSYNYKPLSYGKYYAEYNFFVYSENASGTDGNKWTAYLGVDSINPLTKVQRSFSFDLPQGLRESKDGSIAVLLDFATSDQYVLILRENGVNRY